MSEILQLPLMAPRGMVVLPRMVIHFELNNAKSIRALEDAMKVASPVFFVAQKREGGVYRIGTVADIKQLLKLPNNRMRVRIEGVYRAELISLVPEGEIAHVKPLPDNKTRLGNTAALALMKYTLELFEEYAEMSSALLPEMVGELREIQDMSYMGDFIAQSIFLRIEERQSLLEDRNPARRLEKLGAILNRELEVLRLEHQLQDKMRVNMIKTSRDHFLREQLRTIQEELGDDDSGSDDYRSRIAAVGFNAEASEKLLKEVKRLEENSPHSPETGLIRNYLDTVLDLPWNKTTKDRADLTRAAAILKRDHYGLEKVKERILEFLAVKKLAPELKGQVICLIGPPGVGKTSVAASVARAMNRKLGRLSLGGVRDEADIRGHRKTYIGAMPGRVITAVKQAGVKNPVLLMDEIDKMGHDFRGDPAAALLEVFDGEQNCAFRDHFVELPFDLSDALFITTANTAETIPRALLDRMEIIELSSYTDEEKLRIAKKHLLPKVLKKHGLTPDTLKISDGAIRDIIVSFTRESGVRKLEQRLAAICRKAARKIGEGAEYVSVKSSELEEYLGAKRYKPESKSHEDEIGLANGLAWTQSGGDMLQVETGVVAGKGKLELTGNLGDVMKESAKAAITYIRGRADKLNIDPEFYKNKDIHIHFPEGAIPKDGPSAGITMAVAMVSALTGVPVRNDVAMTGEITLRGRVLPIGGLKEKTMAALRHGIKTVIIPRENERDLDDIDPLVREALCFKTAAHIDAVLEAALRYEN